MERLILGFTGTREGMTDVQREAVAEFLRVNRPIKVHHGDCVGADSQFHDSALLLPKPPTIVSHPPLRRKMRAFRDADYNRPPKPYLERNKDIVRESEQLLAAPKGTQLDPRSGTAFTIRCALAARKTVTVVWSDGTVQAWGYTSLAEIFG